MKQRAWPCGSGLAYGQAGSPKAGTAATSMMSVEEAVWASA
ncbi:hypothetical protein [Bifidobacterium indicum]